MVRLKTISALVWPLALFVGLTQSVDRSKFRTCAQSSFCNRARNMAQGDSKYELDLNSVSSSSASTVEAILTNAERNVRFKLEINGLDDATFRVRVREESPLVPRFEVPHVLVDDIKTSEVKMEKAEDSVTVSSQGNSVKLTAKPFKMDFFSGDVLVLSVNSRGLFRFEESRVKPENPEEIGNDEWEESFGGNTDSKPNGPQAIAADFTFVNSDHVYGIPEHADTLNLKDTVGVSDPYRLYNLDVFEYELWNPMALYAAVPFMVSHTKEKSVGLFWLNAAETWIDVQRSGSGVLGSISNLVSSEGKKVDTHWMSESGIVDFFVLLGPKPKDVNRQYIKLTGPTQLPPEFSQAYHQCRWNYNSQEDVAEVNAKFDEYDMPMDVMWLDIEHTDGKKYFTWDPRKFGDSLGMIQNLTAVGRKLVAIVDPHIKKDNNYWVHKELTDLGLYTKHKDGKDYEGWCWPGASYYPDFLNPAARNYFSEQYALDKYVGSNLDTFTWNDMNEPSVFNGPEVTMPKDIMHGEWEHRDLHNMYGHLYVMATHAGHLLRSEGKLRPFILTRSAFAGSQKYTSIWTGDNTAEWGHLKASVPMCLSLSIAGLSHVGADIGGFFGNPDGELMVRWYQAASFTPFFRSHAHIDTKRREPWLFNPTELKLMRQALRLRYSMMPYWYTLFYENEVNGDPPMRPIWYEFPGFEDGYGLDDEHMLGSAILVHPVTEPGATAVTVTFPYQVPSGSKTLWYDLYTRERVDNSRGAVTVEVTYDKIPAYQKGGTILPKKERVRRSTQVMKHDPITLVIAPDAEGKAEGTLYVDDGHTYEYREGKSIYAQFSYNGSKLTGHQLRNPGYETGSWIERVVIMGLDKHPGSAKITSASGVAGEDLEVSYSWETKIATIRKPGVNIAEEWEIEFSR